MNFSWRDKKLWLSLLKVGAIVSAIVLLIPFVLNITLFQFTTGITYKGGDWLSFWGSYLGGFSSGIVALFIALATIREDRRRHSYSIMLNQLPVMARIEMELVKIIDNIDRAIRIREDTKKGPIFLEDHEFQYKVDVELIDREKWESLDKLQDIDLQIKLLELRQFYEMLSESLRYDALNNKQDLKMKKFKASQQTRGQTNEYRLVNEIAELASELEYHYQNRTYCFDKLEKGYRDKIDQILEELSNAKNEIQQKKKNFEEKLK